jgi:hypothetical protein
VEEEEEKEEEEKKKKMVARNWKECKTKTIKRNTI